MHTHVANPVRVTAVRILEVTDITNRAPGCAQSHPDVLLRLEDGRNFTADMTMTSRHVPVPGDYLVTQEDGYVYLNPKDVFERKYSRAPGPATDDGIEAEIVAKGKIAPRVTPADIEANIAGEHYFTADQPFRLPHLMEIAGGVPNERQLSLLTFCVLVLRNGFTVTGESACASPENFDAEIGRKIARQNAVAKIWPLMGYALKQQLAQA